MKLDALFVKFGHFTGQCHAQQVHQAGNFLFRSLPIFRRESKDAQHRNAPVKTGLYRAAQCINPYFVACYPRQKSFFGPTAIAIHDHGHVMRNGNFSHSF